MTLMRPLALLLAAVMAVSGCCQIRKDRDEHVERHSSSAGSWNFQGTGNFPGGSGQGVLLLFGVVIVVVLVVAIVDSCGC